MGRQLKPQYMKALLNEVATPSDVLSCLHLVSCKHPNLDIGSNEVSNCIRNFILETIKDCSRTYDKHISLQAIDQLIEQIIFVFIWQIIDFLSELKILFL